MGKVHEFVEVDNISQCEIDVTMYVGSGVARGKIAVFAWKYGILGCYLVSLIRVSL